MPRFRNILIANTGQSRQSFDGHRSSMHSYLGLDKVPVGSPAGKPIRKEHKLWYEFDLNLPRVESQPENLNYYQWK